MKLVSWNVNGIRACVNKGFKDYFNEMNADIFCIQETKCQAGQIDLGYESYYEYWNYAEKKGYSGTAIFSKKQPLSVKYGIGVAEYDCEGRAITLEYEDFYLVNIYTPNSQRDLARLDFRLTWEDYLREYLLKLDSHKPVVVCGDMNVAHNEIDLRNPKSNQKNSGFTPEERAKMTELLSAGFIDSFRFFNPDLPDVYTWWSYMNKVRERNIGWRIDYFLVSQKLKQQIIDAQVHSQIMGSDHCPVLLELDV
ncbi:exodeoxyribonuclease III [Bacillus sp. DNRA2]|uniref:exodeoxyribonuclease III n=1 Tax=Bacillus sp. DNRA2 TaxID=2723053 RepID=UPI00145D8B69|nr:exodeoxyribonuclease III [Bacillus sp. DNRA2]NMD69873.1 exodeoxyribonuclease III [Bacillus sp. DNRA2]